MLIFAMSVPLVGVYKHATADLQALELI